MKTLQKTTIPTGRYRTKYIPGVPSNSISFCIFVFLTGSCWVWGKLCWGRGESRVRPEQRHPHSGNERLAQAERKGVLCLVVPVCVLSLQTVFNIYHFTGVLSSGPRTIVRRKYYRNIEMERSAVSMFCYSCQPISLRHIGHVTRPWPMRGQNKQRGRSATDTGWKAPVSV